MRIKRWRDLSTYQKLAFEKRLRRSLTLAVLMGVGFALMAMPDSYFHIHKPGETAWTPLIKGLLIGTEIFAFTFFVATRFKRFMNEDDEFHELVQLEAESAAQDAVASKNDSR